MKQSALSAAVRFCTAGIFLALAGLADAQTGRHLDAGWEFHQGALGNVWEIWRGDAATDNVKWTPVTLPHCFNARDAVDPDVHYYEGPGWYRTHLKIANPYPHGRTLLHFDGAGQKAQVFDGVNQVGAHVGGYDEWDVDITDAVAKSGGNGEVPVAVLCDNSRDAEMILSDLSDFCRYGGLYRHVSLVYVPAISLERVHIEPTLAADGHAMVRVRARLYNPAALTNDLQLALEVRDPQGRLIQSATNSLAPWSGEKEISQFQIASPQLWSPSPRNSTRRRSSIRMRSMKRCWRNFPIWPRSVFNCSVQLLKSQTPERPNINTFWSGRVLRPRHQRFSPQHPTLRQAVANLEFNHARPPETSRYSAAALGDSVRGVGLRTGGNGASHLVLSRVADG